MDKIITVLQERKKSPDRLSSDSSIIRVILNAIREKKGEGLVSLDLRDIDEAVADFFILCEASTHVQIKAIASHVADEVYTHCDEKPYHTEHGAHWTLVDYVNVVVHVFDREQRSFYDLEGLWADAVRTEHNDD